MMMCVSVDRVNHLKPSGVILWTSDTETNHREIGFGDMVWM
jgi:hypothetical protein